MSSAQVTPVPANGVAGLQSAFHINHLLEIQDSFKEAKDLVPSDSQRSEFDGVTSKNVHRCHVHAGNRQELFCEACGILVCVKCVMKGGKHHDHDCYPLEDAFERYRTEMTSSLKPMEKKLSTVNETLTNLEKCCGEISHQREEIETSIHDAFGRLHKVLDIRKTELIGELHQITQRKLKGSAIQRDEMETIQAQLSSCLDFVKESMKMGIQEEVLKMKSNVAKQVKELTAEFQPDFSDPNEDVDTIFMASPDATTVCQNYGQVFTTNSPDPFKCCAEGKGLKDAMVWEKSTAVLLAINKGGEPCTKSLKSDSLCCELVSEITGTAVTVNCEQKDFNHYEISYQPTMKGRHRLTVKVNHQHIKRSPFPITVKSRVENLETPLSSICGLNRPLGVAIGREGEVIITEYWDDCVSIFSPDGYKLRSIGGSDGSSDQEHFVNICGVALDGDGNILVGDKHHIQRFTLDGQFLSAVSTEGSGPPHFKYPCGIAVNCINNRVYVVDASHCVHILNSDLTFFSTFGKPGSGKGQFNTPWGIACDSTGKVYVADSRNNRVQVFTAEGQFIKILGRRGHGRGEFDWPVGIAVDANDFVYVSEGDNHRVSVFTSEGQFVKSFGKKGSVLGEFNGPIGLTVDKSGVVYVCDRYNYRVQAF